MTDTLQLIEKLVTDFIYDQKTLEMPLRRIFKSELTNIENILTLGIPQKKLISEFNKKGFNINNAVFRKELHLARKKTKEKNNKNDNSKGYNSKNFAPAKNPIGEKEKIIEPEQEGADTDLPAESEYKGMSIKEIRALTEKEFRESDKIIVSPMVQRSMDKAKKRKEAEAERIKLAEIEKGNHTNE